MGDYLPRSEARLLTWAEAVASKVAERPGDCGLSTETSAAISAAVADYAQALTRAIAPATRTRANVLLKDHARIAMLKVVRPIVQQIRANTSVAESLKVSLQIRQAGRSRSTARAAAAMMGRPKLHLSAVLPRRHVLGFGRLEADGSKAKPAGAMGLQVFLHIGDDNTAPADPLDARFLRFISRQPYAVDFKAEQVGKTAFYFARWQTATGETGPWSPVLKMTVAG